MKNKKFILSISFALGIFIAGLLLDLLSKHYVIQALPNVGDSMDVIPGFINFIHVQNSGAAWGIFEGRSIFLIIVSILILGIYIWFYALRLKKLKNASSITLGISVGFIAGGCIGNLVDRIAFGYVRDFINFEFMEFARQNKAIIISTDVCDSEVSNKIIDFIKGFCFGKNAKFIPLSDEKLYLILPEGMEVEE